MKCPCTCNLTNLVKTKFKPVTHVIFDLDGIVIDSENVYKEAFRKTIADYGLTFNFEFYRQISGAKSENVAKTAIEHYNLDVTNEDFVKKYRYYSKNGLGDVQLVPGVDRMITHLSIHGVPIAIASSSSREHFLLKTANVKDLVAMFYHVVLGGDPEVKHDKPEPDIYLACASRFESKPHPSMCLVFEDSTIGMKAGLAAGMQVVMIPNEAVTPETWQLATLKIDSFYDMKPELFGLPPFPL